MGGGYNNWEVTLVPDQTISDQAAATTFATASASSVEAPWGGAATVRIVLATTSTLELRVTPIGGSEVTGGLFNKGNTLTAGNGYTFDFTVTASAKYGFRVATAQSGDLEIAVSASRV